MHSSARRPERQSQAHPDPRQQVSAVVAGVGAVLIVHAVREVGRDARRVATGIVRDGSISSEAMTGVVLGPALKTMNRRRLPPGILSQCPLSCSTYEFDRCTWGRLECDARRH